MFNFVYWLLDTSNTVRMEFETNFSVLRVDYIFHHRNVYTSSIYFLYGVIGMSSNVSVLFSKILLRLSFQVST